MGTTFWNSELFQTLVLIATVGVTLWIYFARRRENVRTAATILTLQIREIEQNIEYLLSEGVINGLVQEKPLHYSSLIFEENNWHKYAHLMVGKIPQLSFENIDTFFKVAQKIREQQIFIKNKLQQAMDYKGMYYYNGIYSRANNLLDRAAAENGDLAKTKDICHQEITFIKSLYSDSVTNIPSFIQTELVIGLEKTLKQYNKLTDGTAYAELEKLKK